LSLDSRRSVNLRILDGVGRQLRLPQEKPMRVPRFRIALPLALALGCAGTPPPPAAPPVWNFASASVSSGKELRMRSGERYIQVSIDGDSIYGPNWSLTHGGTFIRGFGAGRQDVQITLKGTHAEGQSLNNPLTVDMKPEENGATYITGLFAGSISQFSISPTIFAGKLGPCSYDLKFDGKRYEGMSSCNGLITPTSLDLPVALASRTDLEVAVVLAIVLGT
jgi:hypothetical protein